MRKIIFAIGALMLIPENIRVRVFSIFNPADRSVDSRSYLIEPGLRIIRNYPIFGAGLGYDTVKNYVVENLWSPEIRFGFTHTHNLFVQIWSEMGILGIVSFLGLIFHNIIRALKNFRNQSNSTRIFTSSLISGIAAMLLCGVADHTLSFSRILLLFWVLIGLLSAARKIGR